MGQTQEKDEGQQAGEGGRGQTYDDKGQHSPAGQARRVI
jgi:hypothetical protein